MERGKRHQKALGQRRRLFYKDTAVEKSANKHGIPPEKLNQESARLIYRNKTQWELVLISESGSCGKKCFFWVFFPVPPLSCLSHTFSLPTLCLLDNHAAGHDSTLVHFVLPIYLQCIWSIPAEPSKLTQLTGSNPWPGTQVLPSVHPCPLHLINPYLTQTVRDSWKRPPVAVYMLQRGQVVVPSRVISMRGHSLFFH